jgi:adenine/guanine phosphoribosyltransferase-like PRPP-binding protein
MNTSDSYKIAKRINNNKRQFVLVQKKLAKHMPVSPCEALIHMRKLGQILSANHGNSKCLVVGFAETATALASEITGSLNFCSALITTTRDINEPDGNYQYFQEEHSHAADQYLYLPALKQYATDTNHVIVVDDEITTGKTARRVIDLLRTCNNTLGEAQYSVASLINSIDDANNAVFQQNGISLDYLERVVGKDFDDAIGLVHQKESVNYSNMPPYYSKTRSVIEGKADPRLGLMAGLYRSACSKLARTALSKLGDVICRSSKILVLGTEECMLPSIYLGAAIEDQYPKKLVRCHSTTRSPIMASDSSADYPIKNSIIIKSFYDCSRTTYLYNLDNYDLAIVVTDSAHEEAMLNGMGCLSAALNDLGCSNTHLVEWR